MNRWFPKHERDRIYQHRAALKKQLELLIRGASGKPWNVGAIDERDFKRAMTPKLTARHIRRAISAVNRRLIKAWARVEELEKQRKGG